ncbi:MAG: type II toxin-antitoxin system RelE/ParE family toxin [Proteobacteria bacterium]|nr:type II toxin-antitoxin system RelE/ParE family toxin [Pseudomonadota bacterium]
MKDIILKTTPVFDRKAKKLLDGEALEELFDYLEVYPEKGDIIQGTGGVRKLRWRTGKNNKGKSGGVRILYHYSVDILILLITLYDKSEKDNITQAERNELKRTVPELVDKYREDI